MDSLTLMTWNVRYFGHGARGLKASPQWMKRIAWSLAAQPEVPDLIALQEVEDGSLRGGAEPQMDRFLAMFNESLAENRHTSRYTGLYFPAHRYKIGKTSVYTTGLAMLVSDTLSIESHNAHQPHDITHIRLASMARLKQRRIAAHVRLRLASGEPLDVYNTHFSLPAFFEVGPLLPKHMGAGSNQVAEAGKLLDAVGALHPQRSLVVMGDFNSAPGSPVYERLVSAGLHDAHRAVTGLEMEELRRHASAGFLHYRMHLDHVFSSGRVRWKGFHAHHIDTGPFAGLSDHAPKIGRLTV